MRRARWYASAKVRYETGVHVPGPIPHDGPQPEPLELDNLTHLLAAGSALRYASLTALRAAVEGEVFRRNVEDARAVYSAIDDLLKRERAYVERCVTRLVIKSPREGIFRPTVQDGTPALGHLLGVVD